MENEEVLSKSGFSKKIEEYAIKNKVELTQAILELCELYDIDFYEVSKNITEDLKVKLAYSAGIQNGVYGKFKELPV